MGSEADDNNHSVFVTRIIPGPPARVFEAWTDAERLQKWWGPAGISCPFAEIDLRVGGQYRIANQMPDQSIVWIEGTFERIEPPKLLIFSWSTDGNFDGNERVSIEFESHEQGTKVTLIHQRIDDIATRDQHKAGWEGCFNSLTESFSG